MLRTEPLSNTINPTLVSFSIPEESRGRDNGSNRETGRRDPTGRTTVPELVKQPVTISIEDGEIKVTPFERDLFDGEQVVWICQELAWEVRFDQVGSNTPFNSDIFGPGLIPPPTQPDINPDAPPDEILGDLSGGVRTDAPEGNYFYTAEIGGFGPLTARMKFIRGPRPR